MLKPMKKRFDIQISTNKESQSKTFTLDKNVTSVNGLLLTSDKDDLLYYRGTQKIELNGIEIFPENYESRLLMSGIHVAPRQRFFELGSLAPGNGIIRFQYQDNDDGRVRFETYRVSLYVDCTIETEL